jgi:hypothetical protein
MPFSTLDTSAATVGIATLAFAIAAPAAAQEYSAHRMPKVFALVRVEDFDVRLILVP